ncbi:MAG: thiamine diphosphokinase [Acidimicrobiia bacterium]|nr:thiamine diphosphokinase [Acidimicrobiia bacterium]
MEGIRTAIVCTGPADVVAPKRRSLPEHDFVVAADSGLDLAKRLGLHVDVAVGDFDSADAASVEEAEDAGATIERHPADKDATDLELALDAALARNARRIVVLGGDGGRPDHALANLLLLGASRYAHVDIEAHTDSARVFVVTHHLELPAEPGALVSLLPIGDGAHGVHTSGLQFPLNGDVLESGSTRGVSNVITRRPATVDVSAGALLAVLPEPTGATP